MTIHENYSLKAYNTFGIDVSARWFAEVTSVDDLSALFSDAEVLTRPRFILGGGSNILFRQNFDGLMVKISLMGKEVVAEDEDHVYVKAGAGEVWHNFVLWSIEQGYAGIENLSLIPGQVGAAPMQNIGAYGVELKDVFHELEAWFPATNELKTFDAEACQFGYRESVFKRALKNQCIITSVTLRLAKQPSFNTSYGAIEAELKAQGVEELSIRAVSNAVINIRQSKLPNPAEIGNAGSFFKNPVIPNAQYEAVKAQHPDVVAYPAGPEHTKLAAGWLIEHAGWKGETFGSYGVHKRQALVLVNYGGASGNEVYDLSERILQSVKEKYDVQLEREVNIL